MKQFLTTLFVAFISLATYANQGIIRGTIIEDATGLTVIGANVLVNELGTGTITDIDGAFSLSLEPGIYTFTISYVGLKDFIIEDVEVSPEKINILGQSIFLHHQHQN